MVGRYAISKSRLLLQLEIQRSTPPHTSFSLWNVQQKQKACASNIMSERVAVQGGVRTEETTLSSITLMNEVWVRLIQQPRHPDWEPLRPHTSDRYNMPERANTWLHHSQVQICDIKIGIHKSWFPTWMVTTWTQCHTLYSRGLCTQLCVTLYWWLKHLMQRLIVISSCWLAMHAWRKPKLRDSICSLLWSCTSDGATLYARTQHKVLFQGQNEAWQQGGKVTTHSFGHVQVAYYVWVRKNLSQITAWGGLRTWGAPSIRLPMLWYRSDSF